MKLNPDCIRDILIVIEEHTSYKIGVSYPSDSFSSISNLYSDMMIRYHILQASKAGLIELSQIDSFENMKIDDLTPTGHDFLNNIRSDNTWSSIKSICQKVGSTSLSALVQISTGVITALIKSQLGLT